jgi:S-adenosylmethionine hydrolase
MDIVVNFGTVVKKTMRYIVLSLLLLWFGQVAVGQSKALVFQTDFGLKDGAVAAMKGVAYSVDSGLQLFDLTHEIPAYNIWEASYRLRQAAPYWPAGTVFVSVIDPGVGSERKSIVMKTKSGHYFVTPDNGTLTLIADDLGIAEVRLIDETKNRLKNSSQSYTFHGRDVYAYTGARLAAGIISFEQVGITLGQEVVMLDYQKPVVEDGKIRGSIDILDIQYGNVWTNIDQKTFAHLALKPGDMARVKIQRKGDTVFERDIVFGNTFTDVAEGQPVGYLNSLMNFALGINRGSFAERFRIGSGPEWKITLSKK